MKVGECRGRQPLPLQGQVVDLGFVGHIVSQLLHFAIVAQKKPYLIISKWAWLCSSET